MLRALCFSGKPWCACGACGDCDACGGGGGGGGGWTCGVKVVGGGATGGDAPLGGGSGGGGSLTADAEAIFLNFLWRYFPSDSSQRCSTGSMAGTFNKGGK